MTSALDAAFNFTDLQGLNALRREGAADSPDARRAVAQQFEALFLNLMLKEMRTASTVDDGLFNNEHLALHQSMLDQQLALSLARGNGTGLTQSILQALGGSPPSTPASVADKVMALRPRASTQRPSPLGVGGAGTPAASEQPAAASPPAVTQTATQTATQAVTAATSATADFSSPEAFVAALWPHAEAAARKLGTSPDVLVAQAALETGWGRGTIRDSSGKPSFNMFGVKASADWSGPRAVASTLEFSGGVPQPQRAAFRSYASVAASFDDYVALVKGPRYSEARSADTPEGYVRGLQDAGYATDPQYADKIMAILARGLPGHADQVDGAPADILNGMTEIQANADRVEL